MKTAVNKIVALALKAGAVYTFHHSRPGKTLKSYDGPAVVKVSTFQARTGVDYENMRLTCVRRIDGRAPEVPQARAWGTVTVPHRLVSHAGKSYIMLKPVGRARVTWFLGGKKVDKAVIADILKADEKRPYFPSADAGARDYEFQGGSAALLVRLTADLKNRITKQGATILATIAAGGEV
jgi:hypothetical protein